MPKDHLIRMASRIQRQLPTPGAASNWEETINELICRLHALENHGRLARLCRARGWYAAAAAKELQLLYEAPRIESAAARLHLRRPLVEGNVPTLRTIAAELQQLQDEFEDFEIDLKQGLVSVSTDHIVLEEIDLGPFSIELHVNRLAERPDSDCLKCIALEPNPASGNDGVTHPHVQDGHLCAGDATTPISAALREGRIADAFILIRSVLQNYNDSSPYVSLENWNASSCEECGYQSDSEHMYFCQGCEKDVCEDCYSSCDICDQSCCRSCLERDTISGMQCCSNCRRICSQCDRTVDEDSHDEETELCPACLKEHQANQEQEVNHEPDPPISDQPAITPATTAATTTASHTTITPVTTTAAA